MSDHEFITKPRVSNGSTFGRWTVIDAKHRRGGHTVATCRCECGAERTVRHDKLLNGTSKSCGCLRAELRVTHGMTASAVRKESHEYWVWNTMVQRCTNPNIKNFSDYGGRGITVADAWLKFEGFFADMGPRPSDLHSLERTNNNLGYIKENCVWAERATQARNKRNNRMITANGETHCLQEWANRLGVNHTAIIQRIRLGWTPEAAVTTPKNSTYNKRPK